MYILSSMRVGVAGASGYAGTELLRLLAAHPSFEVQVASAQSHEGERVGLHTPSLAAHYEELIYAPNAASSFADCELVFLALPHGASQALVPELMERQITVIDLGADFRLAPETYAEWYGTPHEAPALCESAIYGLVERNRAELPGARLVAVPGCYPTATILGLGPFVDAGAIETSSIIVDAASGVSGAGRGVKEHLHFSAVDESFSAYGLLDHRHTAEMEAVLSAQVLFTPHLVPMVRGMLVTAYARPTGTLTSASAKELLHAAYDEERFVHVVTDPPTTKSVTGSNAAVVTARVDPRTGYLLVLSAIDNLGKGAAGQAVQCANVVVGIDEAAGLSNIGLYP
jgi:N-acetyl-gamma-glutamyl-phosphate reductase